MTGLAYDATHFTWLTYDQLLMTPNPLRLLILLAVWPLAAHAYIDPGSGMLLIQGLIAFVGAVIVFVRNPIKTVKGMIDRIFKSEHR
jgi:hypothetical protein